MQRCIARMTGLSRRTEADTADSDASDDSDAADSDDADADIANFSVQTCVIVKYTKNIWT
jgi:hypothetical protein